MMVRTCLVLPRHSIQASNRGAPRRRARSASVIKTATLRPPGVAAVYHQPSRNDSISAASAPGKPGLSDSSKKTVAATNRSQLIGFRPPNRDSSAARPVASTTQRAVRVPASPQSIVHLSPSNLIEPTLAARGMAPRFSASAASMRSNRARSSRQPMLWTSRKNSLLMSSGPPQALAVRKDGQWESRAKPAPNPR